MIAAVDVQYDDEKSRATVAAVVFECWEDATPSAEYTAIHSGIPPYVPGEFFRRELPCLTAVLDKIQESIEVLVIDGYVQLGDKPGLGAHLWEQLRGTIPVIGVAKSKYHSVQAIEVVRGDSRSPLLVTSIGIDPQHAADCIRRMHGPHRVPTLLKRVDQRAREQ